MNSNLCREKPHFDSRFPQEGLLLEENEPFLDVLAVHFISKWTNCCCFKIMTVGSIRNIMGGKKHFNQKVKESVIFLNGHQFLFRQLLRYITCRLEEFLPKTR